MGLDIVQGWTEAIEYQLSADGSPVNLNGMTVVFLLYPTFATTPKTLTGSVALTDAAAGKVTFTPGASDLKAADSPASIRWKVTDTGGNVAFFPRDLAEVWNIQLP